MLLSSRKELRCPASFHKPSAARFDEEPAVVESELAQCAALALEGQLETGAAPLPALADSDGDR
jgi:hypothetical protein